MLRFSWIHSGKAEGIILKYLKDETRLWEKARKVILCL